MQREIKFRAWDGRTMTICPYQGAIYGALCFTKENGYIDGEYKDSKQPLAIMQYVGQTDVDGKEIYEGDILRYELEPLERNFYDMESHGIGYVRWDDFTASWVVAVDKVETVPKTFFQNQTRNYEIIGNLYENPELMPEAA